MSRPALILALSVLGACSSTATTRVVDHDDAGGASTGGGAGNSGTGGAAGTGSSSGSGGTSAGGTSAGGTSAGGTSAGGTSAGGTSAGGTSAGGTSAGGTSAGGDAGSSGDAGHASATGSDAGADAAGPCGANGAGMIEVGDYCIDATEVTAGAYAAFVAASPSLAAEPGACAWNHDVTPTCAWPAAEADLPVVCVDWCDAHAYCAWNGQRLCGQRTGGATPFSRFADAEVSQWFRVCSLDGQRVFPYGGSYDAPACNGWGYGVGARVPVKSAARCVGGFAGVFDMSGNVREWEDSCDASAGAADPCRTRGGSFALLDEPKLACDTGYAPRRDTTADNVGFRCCTP